MTANNYTKTALSFVSSETVRNALQAAGLPSSPEHALSLIFNSDRPQEERFPAMMDILAEINSPEARQLSDTLRQLTVLTSPSDNPHYIFIEKYTNNPRCFLTIDQLKGWLKRNPDESMIVDVYSRGIPVFRELCMDRTGIYYIFCPEEQEKLFMMFDVPPTIFQPGDIVMKRSDSSLWAVISADFSLEKEQGITECEICDFSAMVVPYEYREYATPELIKRHYTEREPGTADIISLQHEHIYLPLLEFTARAEK